VPLWPSSPVHAATICRAAETRLHARSLGFSVLTCCCVRCCGCFFGLASSSCECYTRGGHSHACWQWLQPGVQIALLATFSWCFGMRAQFSCRFRALASDWLRLHNSTQSDRVTVASAGNKMSVHRSNTDILTVSGSQGTGGSAGLHSFNKLHCASLPHEYHHLLLQAADPTSHTSLSGAQATCKCAMRAVLPCHHYHFIFLMAASRGHKGFHPTKKSGFDNVPSVPPCPPPNSHARATFLKQV
jgi:hypothetical protein